MATFDELFPGDESEGASTTFAEAFPDEPAPPAPQAPAPAAAAVEQPEPMATFDTLFPDEQAPQRSATFADLFPGQAQAQAPEPKQVSPLTQSFRDRFSSPATRAHRDRAEVRRQAVATPEGTERRKLEQEFRSIDRSITGEGELEGGVGEALASRLGASAKRSLRLFTGPLEASFIGAGKAGTQALAAAGGLVDFLAREGRLNTEATSRRFRESEDKPKQVTNPVSDLGRTAFNYWDAQLKNIEKTFPTSDITKNPEVLLDPEYWVETGMQAVTSMSEAVVAGGGTIIGGALAGATMEAAPMYERLEAEGDKHAADKALAFGVAVAALEKVGLDKIFTGSTVSAARRVVTSMMSEAVTEWAEEPVGAMIENLAKEGITPTEYGAKALEAARSGLNAIPGALVAGGGASTISSVNEGLPATDPAVEPDLGPDVVEQAVQRMNELGEANGKALAQEPEPVVVPEETAEQRVFGETPLLSPEAIAQEKERAATPEVQLTPSRAEPVPELINNRMTVDDSINAKEVVSDLSRDQAKLMAIDLGLDDSGLTSRVKGRINDSIDGTLANQEGIKEKAAPPEPVEGLEGIETQEDPSRSSDTDQGTLSTTQRQSPEAVASMVAKRNLSLISRSPEVRRLFANIDAEMETNQTVMRQTHKEGQAEARRRLSLDPFGELYQQLVDGSLDFSDPVNKFVAKALADTNMSDDLKSGDPDRILRARIAALNFRNKSTQIAQSNAANRDPLATPEQRVAEELKGFFSEPSEAVQKKLDKAKTNEKRDSILRKEGAKMDKVRKRLSDLAIDITRLDVDALADRRKMAMIMRELQTAKASFSDKEFEFWRNAILSHPKTWIVNVIGNSLNTVTEYTMLRPLEATLNKLTGNKIAGATTFSDLGSIYKGAIPGIANGWKAAVESWVTEMPTVEGTKFENAGLAIGGKLGQLTRLPQRILLTADEFAKSLIVQMEVVAQAAAGGRTEGLSGDRLSHFIEDQVQNSDSQAWAAARDKSRELSFQAETGEIAHAVANSRAWGGAQGFVARHVVPFINTPVNLLKTALRRSPLGAAGFVKDAINKSKGKEVGPEVLRRSSEQLLAWGMVMILRGMVNPDDEDEKPKLTGSPSRNSAIRDQNRRQNLPPLSVRLGDTWFSYARIEPIATQLSLVADAIKEDGSTLDQRVLKIAAGLVRDKTFMRGISDLLDAYESEDPRKIAEYSSNFAASYVPNIVRGTVRDMEPKVRSMVFKDPDNIWGEWLKRTGSRALPVGSLLPPPKIDPFGREIRKSLGAPGSDFMWRLLSPVNAQQETDIVDIDRMIVNWNAKADKPYAARILYPSSVKEATTEEQYVEFLRERGRMVTEMFADREFNVEDPSERDMERLSSLFGTATTRAKRNLKL